MEVFLEEELQGSENWGVSQAQKGQSWVMVLFISAETCSF